MILSCSTELAAFTKAFHNHSFKLIQCPIDIKQLLVFRLIIHIMEPLESMHSFHNHSSNWESWFLAVPENSQLSRERWTIIHSILPCPNDIKQLLTFRIISHAMKFLESTHRFHDWMKIIWLLNLPFHSTSYCIKISRSVAQGPSHVTDPLKCMEIFWSSIRLKKFLS